jgi:cytochrome b6-f complex iron-sulfur subunit
MERREFLGSLSSPVVAVCAVCMGACSKSADNGNGTPGVVANFTVDLGTQLKTIGSSFASNGVLVARLDASNTPASFVAVQQACTHQGTSINYVSTNHTFLCPNHGAEFSTSGANIGGQSTSALKVYTISITGITMTVSG